MAGMINLSIQLCCGNPDCPLALLLRMMCGAQWLNAIIKFLVCKGIKGDGNPDYYYVLYERS